MHHPTDWDLDQMPGPALLVGGDGSIVRANARADRLFEYGDGELAGLKFEKLIHTDHLPRCRQLLDSPFIEQADQSPNQLTEFRGTTREGHEIALEIGVGPAAGGPCALVLLHDITDAARTLSELRERERHLRVGFSHTTDLIQYLDIDQDSLGWYGDLDGLLGYEPSEFPNTISGWFELIHPDDVARVQAGVEQVIANDEDGWSFRYRIRCKDGSYRHLLDRGSVTGHVDGRPNYGIGGLVDETEQVLARQKVEDTLIRANESKGRLQAESSYLQEEIRSSHGFDEMIGTSDALVQMLAQVESVAGLDTTVLLLGETGTGKELLARAVHRRSQRKHRPLIKVDCATLPAGLIESELFGHEKGAFTGAHEKKVGRFELAESGTIFLDEIGELPLDLQAKLLQVIEEGEFRRVGDKLDRTVDTRVIAATNRDLRREVQEGRFRADLYYRLSVFPIEAPPLRERREDIPKLISFFTAKYAASFGKSCAVVDPRTLDMLIAYDWPGNIRELRNLIERGVILCTGDTLRIDPAILGDGQTAPSTEGPLKRNLQGVERARIIRTLEETGWRIKGEDNAARRLGITASGLRSKMKRLGITRSAREDGNGREDVAASS